MLVHARTEAERIVREAYAEGLRRGTEAGRAQFFEAVGQSAEALRNAADAVRRAHDEFLESLTPQVLVLVQEIARRVLRREATADPELVRVMARAALSNLLERERVTMHFNPADLNALQERGISFLEEFDGTPHLSVVPHESVAPGGCIVETDALYVDARLDAQLEKVFEALTEQGCGPS